MSTEHIVASVLCTLFALLFAKFSAMNLLGARLGKGGRRFVFEMDVVMGGLLGIPKFSRIEGTVLGLGAAGALLAWSRDPTLQMLTVIGLLLIVVYMVVCSVYAIYARQPFVPYLAFCFLLIGLTAWRATR